MLVVFEESCRGGDSTAEVRDSRLIGRMHAKDVARVIGAKFAEYDIPFRFPSIGTGSAGW